MTSLGNMKMLIKEKLIDLNTLECHGMFCNFFIGKTYPRDIILIQTKLRKLAFCAMKSQNGSGSLSLKKDIVDTLIPS